MNKRSHPPQEVISIIGMDVSTHNCQDLNSFNRFLVTGIFEESTYSDYSPNDFLLKGDTKQLQQKVLNRIKQLLFRCQKATSKSNTALPSILLHIPSKKTNKRLFKDLQGQEFKESIIAELEIDRDNISVVTGNFGDALLHILAHPDISSSAPVALISLFQYVGNNQSPDVLLGMGCVLLSPNYLDNSESVEISLTDFESNPSLDENQVIQDLSSYPVGLDSSMNYAYFQFAPAIRFIGAILELQYRSRFSLLHTNSLVNNSGNKTSDGILVQPWFLSLYSEKRQLFMNIGNSMLISLQESHRIKAPARTPFMSFGYYLLPVPIDDGQSAHQIIKKVIESLSKTEDIEEYIANALKIFQLQNSSNRTLVIVGNSAEDLINELERAKTAIAVSLESGKDWQTPNGTFFTPSPLGPDSKVAFVYPGAFSTYIGMGSEIFYLFPDLYDKLDSITSDPSASINESIIFPQNVLPEEFAQLQDQLSRNPIRMITAGVCFSYLFTEILSSIFKVNQDAAFGYSLGENSMMFALGIWKQADAMRTSLEVSPIFHSRVSGAQEAIRQFWDLPQNGKPKDGTSIWANYVLMAPLEKVRNVLTEEDQVYITHINAPRQVVIGGEKNSCRRVVEELKCMNLQAPYNHAIHCAPVVSEYNGFLRLHDWPVENHNTIPVYSAANYAPLEHDSKAIAHAFAKMLTNPIDFPRLVDLAYQDGARIFIELGAGSNCTKWVDSVLKKKPHLAVSINNNNVRDHISILRFLARLISHGVTCDIEPLWKGTND